MSTISNTTPAQSGSQGILVSTSCNMGTALQELESYLQSTYDLQAADTQLQAAISNEETLVVQQFEETENAPGGALYELEHASPTLPDGKPNPNYSTQVSQYAGQFGADQAANQALTKVMDANNSTAQNTLSQNSQGQQGIISAMQAILSVPGNLKNLIQG